MELHARTLSGLEEILADELRALGATEVATRKRLVTFHGDQELLYQANLCCRTAIRFLQPIHRFAARSEKELYSGIRDTDWSQHLRPAGKFAIDPLVRSSFCSHSLYAAQLAKDAIVDQFRERTGGRPSVDLETPDLRISLYLHDNQATLYLDASGDSLHKRGYRKQTGKAPLSEVLAAGIVLLSGWDRLSPLQDPMCGSGTLLIEAALIAKNIVPGLLGRRYGFENWLDYDQALHRRLLDQARKNVAVDLQPAIIGSDWEAAAIATAKSNAKAAGVGDCIRFSVCSFDQAEVPDTPGVVLLNPPYDERLSLQDAVTFYQQTGDVLKHRFAGCKAFVLTGNLDAAKHIGLRASKKTVLYNGPIECRLLRFELFKSAGSAPSWRDSQTGTAAVPPKWHAQFEMFENRLRKMAKHWGKWARRQGVACYRIYDRDIPDVPLTVDRYEDMIYCAEFDRPHEHTAKEHRVWLDLLQRKIADILQTPFENVHLKKRERQRGTKQYHRQQESGQESIVTEGGHRFLVNLTDYLDTGLFLDHRITRSLIQEQAHGKRFLNLFGYTGSFTVYAAAGGAKSTTTVDTSNTYLKWASRNMEANGFTGSRHQFIRRDVLELLNDCRGVPLYDLVVVDPPTFSNNKTGQRLFDVQRDHVHLLQLTAGVVPSGGRIYFSTNRKKFRFEYADEQTEVLEITGRTVPPDFQRKRPHRCWLIQKR